MKIAAKKQDQTHMHKLRAELAQMRAKLSEYEAQVEGKIQENPMASVGVAFGTGMLLGAVVGLLLSKK